MISSLIPKYDPVLFSEIHQISTFLPAQENEDSVRSILNVAGFIAVFHLVLLYAIKLWQHSGKGEGKPADEKKAWKFSYQLTNLLVNLTLACLGICYQINIPWDESIMNKIAGYEHVKLFAIGQVGFQLWALPVGYFFVGETKEMLVHHIAVICVGSVSTFLRCGFRYYIPYFYGVIEISSVPLSIVNSFKSNRHWIKAYPDMYSVMRLVFGVTFLLVRAILWTPLYWSSFAHASMLFYSSETKTSRVILALFTLSSLVLTFLQYSWARKIISMLVPKKTKN